MLDPAPLRVLIVEDGPITRAIFERYVAKHPGLSLSASVATAADAAGALSHGDVDLVILDVELPDASGFAIARRLGPDVPFVVTTTTEDYAMDGFRYRAADYLLKPVGYRRFSEAVDRAARLRRSPPPRP